MGAIDDLIDDYDPEQEEADLVQHLEKYWSRGKHKDQTGKVWKIKEMTTFHLQNTIQMFGKIADVSRLLKELNKR